MKLLNMKSIYMLKECNTESLLHFPVFYYNWSILSLQESEEMNSAPLFCVCNCNNYKFLWDITVNKKYYQLGRDQTLTGENTQKTEICSGFGFGISDQYMSSLFPKDKQQLISEPRGMTWVLALSSR